MRLKFIQLLLFIILVTALSSCSSQVEGNNPELTKTIPGGITQKETEHPPKPTETNLPEAETTLAETGQENNDEAIAPTLTEAPPEPTPTVDNRLLPEEWRSWSVIPTLSPAMIEIYQTGIDLGNRPEAFSKVGDCQIIPEVFLGFYDDIYYALPEEQNHLQEALDYFSGSFAREGMALKGGFVFPTVFSPLRADSSVCDPGETPFECELRVHQPAFVLISMEFRYEGRTAEIHEKYLRQSVEYALSRGMVPILATKADNFEGDHSLNLMTAKIAYEYDLPLWNYWRAVQHLPDHGIDWERDSYGFHVTTAAWYVRSHSFLIVLDSLWKEVNAYN
jgi:hypothetical protein